MIQIFHIHTWEQTPHTFALLPKMNVPAQKGIEGKIQKCECGAYRWMHPKLRTVAVEIVKK